MTALALTTRREECHARHPRGIGALGGNFSVLRCLGAKAGQAACDKRVSPERGAARCRLEERGGERASDHYDAQEQSVVGANT